MSGELSSGTVSRFHLASGAANSGHIASGSVLGSLGGGAFNIASGTIALVWTYRLVRRAERIFSIGGEGPELPLSEELDLRRRFVAGAAIGMGRS